MDLEAVWDSTSYGLLVLIEMHYMVEWQQGINLLFNKEPLIFLSSCTNTEILLKTRLEFSIYSEYNYYYTSFS